MLRCLTMCLCVLSAVILAAGCNSTSRGQKSDQLPQPASPQPVDTSAKQSTKPDQADQSDTLNPNKASGPTAASDRSIADSIVGQWESNCMTSPDASQSLRMVRDYTKQDLVILLTSYNDGACTRAIVEQRIVMTYSLGAASAAANGAFEFDGLRAKTRSKFLDQTILTTANQRLQTADSAECRAIVYRLNEEVEDTACSGNRNEYSVVQVSGQNLRIGECVGSNACQSASSRASALSSVMEFKKKN